MTASEPQLHGGERTPRRSSQPRRAVTPRALLLGLVGLCAVCLWIHYAELVRNAGELANTSLPIGAFDALLLLVGVNWLVRKLRRRVAFAQGELLTVYVMLTTGTVVASAGGIHFLVPRLASAFYFANPQNGWAQLFHGYIPAWLAPRDGDALKGFFLGQSSVPVRVWLVPAAVWTAMLTLFLFVSLCIASLLQGQWIKRERLTFPTLVLPLEITREGGGVQRSRLLWWGFALSFGIAALNTAQANFPYLPSINVRGFDLSNYFVDRPWNAIGMTPVRFHPFVIGMGYLIPLDTTLSVWFFYLLIRVEKIFGAMMGWYGGEASGILPRFPLSEHQGAGAFLGLAVFSLWRGREFFREAAVRLWRSGAPTSGRHGRRPRFIGAEACAAEEWDAPLPYHVALLGAIVGLATMVGVCALAGASVVVPLAFLVIALLYIITATRVRAETGAAWLMGTGIHPYVALTTLTGTRVLSPADQTIMAYVSLLCMHDLRTLSMPHQMDGFKLADGAGMSPRRLTAVMLASGTIGIIVAFWSGLSVWYHYGAAVKCEQWRTMIGGKMAFDGLQASLQNPSPPDVGGAVFIGVGFLFTGLLTFMRSRFLWFPFHPAGYVVANTRHWAVAGLWFPFFIAWVTKSFILRYGGMRMYRRVLPFFLGLILGDFIGGGLGSALGCLLNIKVYSVT